MNRRRFIAAAALALWPRSVGADLTGSARLHKADATCRRAGRARERFGLKPRERSQLERMHCQKIDGEWRTTMIAQAD